MTAEQLLEAYAAGERDFRGADLFGADLRSAHLNGADLRGAFLRDANLSYADLRGADLSFANLTGANLNRALIDAAPPWLVQGSRHLIKHLQPGRIVIGCCDLTIQQWLDSGGAIGLEKGYSRAQIEEYRRYVELIAAAEEEVSRA